MKTLKITEGSQTIVESCNADTYVAPNAFLADLIAKANVAGKAIAKDADGCEVTVTIS